MPSQEPEPMTNETIEEAAARYEADKDADEWGEPVRRPHAKRLATVVSVRFSADELDAVREAAGDGGVSRFVRDATVRTARRHLSASTATPLPMSTTSSQPSGSLSVRINVESYFPSTGELQLASDRH